MTSSASKGIRLSSATAHYPEKSDLISDVPDHDPGGNFGRFARTGLMDDFTKEVGNRLLAGVPIHAWRRFLRVFTESPTPRALDNLVATLERERRRDPNAVLKSAEQVAQLRTLLGQMADLFGQR